MVVFVRSAIFLALILFTSCVYGYETDYEVLDSITIEKECTHQGGTCVIEKDCPSGHLTATKGLCPQQRDRGIECCYGLSLKETRCANRGGSCTKKRDCGRGPVDKLGRDCGKGEVCCVFV